MVNGSNGPLWHEKKLIHWGFERMKANCSTSHQAVKVTSDKFRLTFSIGFENLQRGLDIDAAIKQGTSNQDP